MAHPLECLIQRLGPVQLIGYTFESKELRFQLFRVGTGRMTSFIVPTDTVHGRTVSRDPMRTSCLLELVALNNQLEVRHERYYPPADPEILIAQARSRLMLAYGRRRSEYRWLLTLKGDYPLLACLVGDLDGIGCVEE